MSNLEEYYFLNISGFTFILFYQDIVVLHNGEWNQIMLNLHIRLLFYSNNIIIGRTIYILIEIKYSDIESELPKKLLFNYGIRNFDCKN